MTRKKTNTARWKAPERCTIHNAAALHAELLGQLQAKPNLEIDVSALTSVDGSFLQMILGAFRHAEAGGREVALVGESPALIELSRKLHCVEIARAVDPEGASGNGR